MIKVGNYKLKYNFESNSQQRIYQGFRFGVGNYKLKYNFESNSQQRTALRCSTLCWEL